MRKHLLLFLVVVFLILTVVGSIIREDKAGFNSSLVSATSNTYLSLGPPLPLDGYTLFAPMQSNITYLIDNSGEIIYTWESDYLPALVSYLLPGNGSIIRTEKQPWGTNPTFEAGGGAGGIVQIIDWNWTVIWRFEYSSSEHVSHHDVEVLPNGNVLVIAWEYKTGEEAIAAGRDPGLLVDGELWPDHIIEVEPTGAFGGNIVWEWHVWDHLIQDHDPTKDNYGIVANHPELIDLNFETGRAKADWNHINSIDYNEDLDQILLSVHGFNEIWVIDHSTTTEEAASHTGGNSGKGGGILYRWGNPQTYRAGDPVDQKFFAQHDVTWIQPDYPGAGNILVFNNGLNRPEGAYSSVDEIIPPLVSNSTYFLSPGSAYEPEEQTWIYTAENPTDFYSQSISGAQRLSNGNTLICDGGGTFFEVSSEKETVWEYVNPFPDQWRNNVFKIRRYSRDFPGLLNLIRPNDVAIANITTHNSTVIQGQEVTMEITVENHGYYTESFDVTIYASTTPIGQVPVTNLEQGANQLLSFVWNTSGFAAGNHTITVEAEVVTNETDTLDNLLVDGTVEVRALHDLAVVNLTVKRTIVGQGYSVAINATIRNQGIFTETFNVTLYANTTISEMLTNITLATGNWTIVTFSWNAENQTKGNYAIRVYSHQVSGEIDVENNNLTTWILVTIPGDVDGDREVNIFDIVMIAGAYGTEEGNPDYNPCYDIDGDKQIDIFDVVVAAGNYGENWQ